MGRNMLAPPQKWDITASDCIAELQDRLRQETARADNLACALRNARTIGMAMGIIAERLGLTGEAAFTLLRTASQSQNRKLHVIAAEIVESGLIPPASATSGTATPCHRDDGPAQPPLPTEAVPASQGTDA